jgi:hypothetical protein
MRQFLAALSKHTAYVSRTVEFSGAMGAEKVRLLGGCEVVAVLAFLSTSCGWLW